MSSVLSARSRNDGEGREARQTWAFRPTLGNLWVPCECVVGPAGLLQPHKINNLEKSETSDSRDASRYLSQSNGAPFRIKLRTRISLK